MTTTDVSTGTTLVMQQTCKVLPQEKKTTPHRHTRQALARSHLDEWQDCDFDSNNPFAKVTLYDNNEAVIGQTQIGSRQKKNPSVTLSTIPIRSFSTASCRTLRRSRVSTSMIPSSSTNGDLHFTSRKPDGRRGVYCRWPGSRGMGQSVIRDMEQLRAQQVFLIPAPLFPTPQDPANGSV